MADEKTGTIADGPAAKEVQAAAMAAEQPTPAKPSESDHVMELAAALETRVAALERLVDSNLDSRIAALEQANAGVSSAEFNTVRDAVNELTRSLDAIEAHLPALAQMKDHLPLINRLAVKMGSVKPKGAGKISN